MVTSYPRRWWNLHVDPDALQADKRQAIRYPKGQLFSESQEKQRKGSG